MSTVKTLTRKAQVYRTYKNDPDFAPEAELTVKSFRETWRKASPAERAASGADAIRLGIGVVAIPPEAFKAVQDALIHALRESGVAPDGFNLWRFQIEVPINVSPDGKALAAGVASQHFAGAPKTREAKA